MKNMQKMMDEMKALEGDDFDRAFIEAMIIHHQQAVEMTEDTDKFQNPRLRQMAKEMHSKQQQEIDEMREIQKTLQ